MRTSHAATALAAFSAGLTAAAVLARIAGRSATAASVDAPVLPSVAGVPDRDAVVLPFARPVVADSAPEQSKPAARCGDSGGRTKAGAPCGARATTGGRCHHHPLAA